MGLSAVHSIPSSSNKMLQNKFVPLLLLSFPLLLFNACENLPIDSGSDEPELMTSVGKVARISQTVGLKCVNSDYRLMRVRLESGQEALTLFRTGAEVGTERLPTDSEVKKFQLDPLKKTANGFEISVEYGDRYYHTKIFEFECEKGEYLLKKFRSERFDTQNPGRVSKKSSAVNPPSTFDRFGLRIYLID